MDLRVDGLGVHGRFEPGLGDRPHTPGPPWIVRSRGPRILIQEHCQKVQKAVRLVVKIG